MKNPTPEQTEIIKNISFSIEQKNNIDFVLTIKYEQITIFRKSTTEISDYWDWIKLPDEKLKILFPDSEMKGYIDFNVYHADTIDNNMDFRLSLYGIDEENNTAYGNDFFLGRTLIPLEFKEQLPPVPYIDYIHVHPMYDIDYWIATAFRVYIGNNKKTLKKIFCQSIGKGSYQTVERCKKKANFKTFTLKYFDEMSRLRKKVA